MLNNYSMRKKIYVLLCIAQIFCFFSNAAPSITSITPLSGKPGDTIIIVGTNFAGTVATTEVYFGNARVTTYQSASSTTLRVIVPVGATYGPITIMDKLNNRYGTSMQFFSPIYAKPKGSFVAGDMTVSGKFATGTNPYNVAVGDIDGDGKPDAAVVNFDDNTVSILRNTSSIGTISFNTKVDFTTGANPYAVAIADMNNDGKLDVVVVNNGANSVSVCINTSTSGNVSFKAKADFTTGNSGSSPNALAIADLDKDGWQDIVISNGGSNAISTLLNTSTTTTTNFASRVLFTASTFTRGVAIADIDGDGKPDIAATNSTGSNVSVFRNTTTFSGTLRLDTKIDYSVGTSLSPMHLAFGDVNSDGKLDIVTANNNGNNISTFINTSVSGTVSFNAAVNKSSAPRPVSIGFADLDADGKIDVAMANNSSSLSVFKNTTTNSNPTYANSIDFATGSLTFAHAMGDIDGDGKIDAVVVTNFNNAIVVVRNAPVYSTNANLSALTTTAGAISPTFTANTTSYTASVSNATTSIAVTPTKQQDSAKLEIQLNGGAYTSIASGSPSSALTLNLGANTINIRVTAQDGTTIKIYTLTVTRNAPPTITSISPTSGAVGTTVTIAGTFFNSTPANNVVFFGAAKATVTAATTTSLTVTVPIGATYAPITILNTASFLTASSKQYFNTTYKPNKGSITNIDMTASANFTVNSDPQQVAIGDIDGDGKVDAVVVDYGNSKVSVLLNTSTTGTVSFATKVDFTTTTRPYSVALGDINNDGKLDIVTADFLTNTVSVFRNTSTSGSVSFAARVDKLSGLAIAVHQFLAVADIDGDGKQDVIIANQGTSNVSVLRNTSASTTSITFATFITFSTVTGPSGIVVGDIDNDGKPDLVVSGETNLINGKVSILRNTSVSGTISFAAKSDYTVGGGCSYVSLGDMNSDGYNDIITGNASSNNVSVLINYSVAGTLFIDPVKNFAIGTNGSITSIADIDGDGKLDIAVAGNAGGGVIVLRNTTTATWNLSFAPYIVFASAPSSQGVSCADIDGDGKVDITAVSYLSPNLVVLRNTPVLSSNNNLTTMSATAGALSPVFDSLKTSYNINVRNYVTSTIVTATKQQDSAKIEMQFNGGSYVNFVSGSTSSTLSLNIGVNTINFKVTAQNGNFKIYTITITRACLAAPSTTNLAVCPSQLPYTWNTLVFTGAGTQGIILTTPNGCDSTATLVLTLKATSTSTTTLSACDSLIWNGTTYKTSGLYTYHTLNSIGCDSAARVNLTIKKSTTSWTDVNICITQLPYTWNGVSYTTTGFYTKTGFTNSAGCDSVAYLNLMVNPTVIPSVAITPGAICIGTNPLLTASATNGGISPKYYWSKNGIPQGISSFINRNTTNGLGSNGVYGVAYGTDGKLYAATLNGLGISSNAGVSFVNRTVANSGLGGNTVNGVAVSTNHVIYAATSGGLSISSNAGVSFVNRTVANSGLGTNYCHAVLWKNNKIYVGTEGGLSTSTDGGNTFTTKTTLDGLGSNIIYGIYVADNGNIYVATSNGFSYSTNGGNTFINRLTASGLGSIVVWGVYVGADNTIYAATSGGLSISTNDGVSFTNKSLAAGLGGTTVYGVWVGDDDKIYAATTGGLSISNNKGTSFLNRTTLNGLGNNTVNAVVVSNNGSIYVGTNGGFSFATQTTTNTFQVSGGILNDVYKVILVPSTEVCLSASSPVSSTVLIVTNQTPSVNISPLNTCAGTDALLTATAVNSGSTAQYYWSVNNVPQGISTFNNRTTINGLGSNSVTDVYVTSNNTIYASTSNGFAISNNGGSTFTNRTSTNGLGTNTVYSIFVTPTNGNIYAATTGGVSISTDGGNTFVNRTTANGLGNNFTFQTFIDNSSRVYAATTGGLAISTDGGNTFSNKTTANGLGSNSIRGVFVTASNIIYAATNAGLSISSDGGNTFTNKTTTNGLGSNTTYKIFVSNNIVYVATGGGLSISTDGGNSFTNKDILNGLGSNLVYAVTTSIDNKIYASTSGGLSISLDGGNTFTNYTSANGLGSSSVISTYIFSNGNIYAATQGGLSMASQSTNNFFQTSITSEKDIYKVVLVPSADACPTISNISSSIIINDAPVWNFGSTEYTMCQGDSITLNIDLPVSTNLKYLHITSPIDAFLEIGTANFGANLSTSPINGNIAYLPNSSASNQACSTLAANTFSGKVALLDRGACSFAAKAKAAQDAGAIGVVIVNNIISTIPPILAGVDAAITIPVISLTQSDGAKLKSWINGGQPVNGNTIVNTPTYLWSTGATTNEIEVKPTKDSTFSVSVSFGNGCSSIKNVLVKVNKPTTSWTDLSVCTDSVVWNGVTYKSSGFYSYMSQNMPNAVGCDSIAYLNLTINKPTFSTSNLSVCDSVIWNNNIYKNSGTYTSKLTNSAGCDSIAILNLTVLAPLKTTVNHKICESALPFTINGLTFNEAGSQIQKLTSSNGCDSFVTHILSTVSVGIFDFATITQPQCDSVFGSININHYTISRKYKSTIDSLDKTQIGLLDINNLQSTSCGDPVVVPNLVINDSRPRFYESYKFRNTSNQAKCFGFGLTNYNALHPLRVVAYLDSFVASNPRTNYLANMQRILGSGNQYANVTIPAGRDVVFVVSNFNNGASYGDYIFEVSGFEPMEYSIDSGSTWQTSRIFKLSQGKYNIAMRTGDTYCTQFYYDNPVLINYKKSTSSTTNLSICPSALPYSWNGLTFTTAGSQTKSGLTNSQGCDSSATLNLTITPTPNSTTTTTAYGSYKWLKNNTTYTTTGTYTTSYTNSSGCTVVDTLKLIINPYTGCFKQVSAGAFHNIAIKTDGTLWAWGYNAFGELGDGSVIDKITPIQIGRDNNWASISAGGYHTTAIKTDGTLWAWGNNSNGELGDGTTANKNSPTKIGTANNWASISAGENHTIALKTDGTLWAWGLNEDGQLGDFTYMDKITPIRIGTANNWASISAGGFHTTAIRTDGTLWAWGANSNGQLGDGTLITNFNPIKIGTASNWATITAGYSHTTAIKTDGTLWAWGANLGGQLGDGTTSRKSTPTLIGTANNWASISTGYSHTTAIKTDGTLWAWGANFYGVLGDGTNINKNTPTQIGTSNNWGSVGAGSYHTTAIKTDGSLWTWGYNLYGQLGDGRKINKNTPTSIGCPITCTSTSSTFSVAACNSYTWVAKGNKVYTTNNNTDTIKLINTAGCDSIVRLNLTVNKPTFSTRSIAICPSALPYSWNGLIFTAAGSQTKTGLVNSQGCDSSATLNLIVLAAPLTNALNFSGCQQVIYKGKTYLSTSTFIDTAKNSLGCDSIYYTVYITVRNTTPTTQTQNLVGCKKILFNDKTYISNTTIRDTIRTNFNCDSIYKITNLTINTNCVYYLNTTFTVSMTNYLRTGNTIDTGGMRIAGNFADLGINLPNWTPTSALCKLTKLGSTDDWSITIPIPDTSINKTLLFKFVNTNWGKNEGIDFGSELRNSTLCSVSDGGGNYNRFLVLPTKDSSVSYCWERCSSCNKTENAPTVTTGTITATTPNKVTVSNNNLIATGGLTVTQKGLLVSTDPNPNIYNNTFNSYFHYTNPSLGTYSVFIGGLNSNKQYYARAYASNAIGTTYGSIIPFVLCDTAKNDTLNIFGCNSLVYNGNTYSSSTIKIDTLKTSLGCDSVYRIINLIVKTSTSSTSNLSICPSALPYSWNGLTFTAAGSQTKTGLTNSQGCDSSATLNLTVKTNTSSTTNLSICPSALPYSWNGLTFTAAGSQTKTSLVNSQGCDSSATLNLSVKTNTSSTTNLSICPSALPYSWNGLTFTVAGSQTKSGLTNSQGCDSSATLNLTVKTNTSSTTNLSICPSALPYSWNGLTFTVAGSQTKTGLVNSQGCDSSATLNLTVKTNTSLATNLSICPSALPYIWNGLTFTAAGSQTKTGLVNSQGCDSSATLNLTVKLNTLSTNNLSICPSALPYSWNGLTFTATGSQTKTGLTNSQGCDSNATLNLTVKALTYDTINRTICSGQIYLGYTATGTYTDTLVNSQGCDSVRTLNLTVTSGVTPTISIATTSVNVCKGYVVVYNAAISNEGINPLYQWYKNGVAVGTNANTFKDSLLNNQDSIWCILISSETCVTNNNIKSNVIKMNVSLAITGAIKTPTGIAINKVALYRKGSITDMQLVNSKYNSSCIDIANSVSLRPTKNNDIAKANGVTSLDVLLTQRHILNTTKLNSAYKIIAADVNGDRLVNSQDILRIRRLILGTDTTFRNTVTNENRLWAFVDSTYIFTDTTNPFPFKDSISFTNLTSNKTNQTFIGVKLGDVNYDWNPALARGIATKPVELVYHVISTKEKSNQTDFSGTNLQNDYVLRIPITVNNFKQLVAMQYTLHFDHKNYEFVGIENNKLNIEFNEQQATKNGNIAMLWTDKNAIEKTLEDGTELFTLVLRSTVNNRQSTDLALTNDIAEIEAWDKDFNQHNIILTKQQKLQTPNTEQWSVSPNPNNGNIKVNLFSAVNKKLTFVITNAQGKMLYTQSFEAVSGNNIYHLNLNKNTKLSAGIYFLKAVGLEGENVKRIMVK
jgi:alpha-tubulin suppressor-like RCC1 family protein